MPKVLFQESGLATLSNPIFPLPKIGLSEFRRPDFISEAFRRTNKSVQSRQSDKSRQNKENAVCQGRITPEQFQTLSGSCTEEQAALKEEIPKKEPAIQNLRNQASGADSFISKARQYVDITELTPELLRLFIRKIVVHKKSVKWSKHAPRTVENYYTDIGYVCNVHGTQIRQETIANAPETERPRRVS